MFGKDLGHVPASITSNIMQRLFFKFPCGALCFFSPLKQTCPWQSSVHHDLCPSVTSTWTKHGLGMQGDPAAPLLRAY